MLIYSYFNRLIVDRYALPEGASTDSCDPGAQTWHEPSFTWSRFQIKPPAGAGVHGSPS
jgi:hypothetical protein